MGAAVGELDVASDTGILRIRHERASRPHGSLARAAVVFFVTVLAAACGEDRGPAPAPAPATNEAARAGEIAGGEAPLPSRAEAVAMTDALAIAAHREGSTPEGARLSRIGADLRARLFRFDQTPSDGREALELYAASAVAAGAAEEGCEAERQRALFAGELAHDAAVSYRELYLALRRREARAASPAPPSPSASAPAADHAPARSRCLAALDMALAAAVAYRPAGDAMHALEQEGNAAALAAQRGAAPGSPQLPAGVAPAVVPVAATAPASAAEPRGDVVVSPKEEAVGKDPVKVVSLEPFGGEDAARVVVHLTGAATFAVGTLAGDEGKGPRVFVDIARASSHGITHEKEVGGLVRRVRVGAHAGGTRVVLDLAATAFRRVFYLPDPFRIVIDVSTHARAEAAAAPDGGTRE